MEEHFSADGLSIVGYLHANERYDDNELGNAARKIGDHIFRYFPRAAAFLVCYQLHFLLPSFEFYFYYLIHIGFFTA